jgi:hypothetical protein
MELILDESASDDVCYLIDNVTISMAHREGTFVDHYGITIDYMNYPHRRGFTVDFRNGGGC